MTPRLNAVDLRQRIVIQTRSGVQDASGQVDANASQWNTIATVWASVTAVTGKDVYALGSGFTGQVWHKVSLRYQAAFLTTNLQILLNNQVFLVLAPPFDPDGRQEQLQMVCQVQDK